MVKWLIKWDYPRIICPWHRTRPIYQSAMTSGFAGRVPPDKLCWFSRDYQDISFGNSKIKSQLILIIPCAPVKSMSHSFQNLWKPNLSSPDDQTSFKHFLTTIIAVFESTFRDLTWPGLGFGYTLHSKQNQSAGPCLNQWLWINIVMSRSKFWKFQNWKYLLLANNLKNLNDPYAPNLPNSVFLDSSFVAMSAQ